MGTTLLVGLATSLGINMAMFLIAFWRQTDKLTDISYALTFATLVIYGVTRDNSLTVEQKIIAGLVLLWAARIGSYLLIRISKTGKDKRFDKMRGSFRKFIGFWLLQALTVWLVMLESLQFITIGRRPVANLFILGIIVFATGLIIEAVSDMQKYKFIQDPKNKGRWIDTGIWKYSRHPNYFGEILVWTGIHIAVFSGFWTTGQQLISVISPLFITFLLLFVSGVPLLEKAADKRWGKDKKYQQYKERTSIIIPLPNK